jgi:hypothetical protein
MTFQPPPSSPPGGAPPPPPGQWNPPPGGGGYPQGGGGAGFDPKNVNPLDWSALAAGLLAFIFSFISYYTADVSLSGSCPGAAQSALDNEDLPSASAWHGFFGWFGTLLAVVGAVLIAIAIFAPQVKLPVPARLAALGAFALATLSTILALFITPGGSASSGDIGLGSCHVEGSVGHGFGYWASLVVIIVGLVLALMRFQQTGGQLPGALNNMPNIGSRGPQGGMGGGPQGPGNPSSGYGGPPSPGPGTPPSPGYGNPPSPGYGNQPPPPPPGYGPPSGQ